jgi:hypothetical protein
MTGGELSSSSLACPRVGVTVAAANRPASVWRVGIRQRSGTGLGSACISLILRLRSSRLPAGGDGVADVACPVWPGWLLAG